MTTDIATYYSNFLNFRLTPNEVVFEFSNFFPDGPNVPPPPDLKPELRVVMNVGLLEQLAKSISEADAARRRGSDAKASATVGSAPGKK